VDDIKYTENIDKEDYKKMKDKYYNNQKIYEGIKNRLDLTQEKTDFNNMDREFALIENRFSEIENNIEKLRKNDANNKKELATLIQEKNDLSRKVFDRKYENQNGDGRTTMETMKAQIELMNTEKDTLEIQFQNS